MVAPKTEQLQGLSCLDIGKTTDDSNRSISAAFSAVPRYSQIL